MKIPFNDLTRIHEPLMPQIRIVLDRIISENSFISGKDIEKFEDSFAKSHGMYGSQNVAGVSSGTDALELILRARNIGIGDEVITVSNTFYATASSIRTVGAKPVFVDIKPDTLLMDVDQVESRITERTRAIMPVHLYGQQADMQKLNSIARKYNLALVEDACQAHGSRQNGFLPGSIGDAAAFSFYPGKNLGAFGDAGAVLSKDTNLIDRIKMLRNYGSKEKYHHDELGFNKRMDTLQAGVLNVKLPHLESWNNSRRESADYLSRQLLDLTGLTLPLTHPGNIHTNHLYVIQVENRNELGKYLKDNGIDTGIHYPVPIHLQPAFAYLGVKKGELPVTEKAAERIISLPIFPEMRKEELDYIASKVTSFLK